MRLLIMGPPGAGKGTQAKLVGQSYHIPVISTGDIFRAMQTSSSPLAQQVRSIMESGGYVTDDITDAIVVDRLNQADCQQGFILDGYPRTLPQVRTLDRFQAQTGHSIDAVISLVVDRDEVVARLLKRATIEDRPDDTEKTIRVRQQVYADQTAPLLHGYRSRGVLVEVDALGPIESVTARILAGLDARQRKGSESPFTAYGG